MFRPDKGQRPIRIANCSGSVTDPSYHLLRQATKGPIDIITGDYLSEATLSLHSRAYSSSTNPGYLQSCYHAVTSAVKVLAEKRIKVILNGGALNPKGLAEEIRKDVEAQGYGSELTVAWVEGDDLLTELPELLASGLKHLDNDITAEEELKGKEVLSCHAYIGSRGIQRALEAGADIIICGRVADAAPVIGAAAWWWGWGEGEWDKLAGALVAGHLIECSAYITGGNFAGFEKFPIERVIELDFGIAEVGEDGSCVVTKHEGTKGVVNKDTVRSQLLYELQGNVYLGSDVKADLTNIKVEEVGKDRVLVTGIVGHPPPPTTKLAIFYSGGYQTSYTIHATGVSWAYKFHHYETQIRSYLSSVSHLFTHLSFQVIGSPAPNPASQLVGTASLRVFAQTRDKETVELLIQAKWNCFMQHFHGMHEEIDTRRLEPREFHRYFPAVVEQRVIKETANIIAADGEVETIAAGWPGITEPLEKRGSYDPVDSKPLEMFGPTQEVPLGEMVLARSGDKGGNINIGLFVQSEEEFSWLRSFLTTERFRELMGEDWREEYRIERCEFGGILAVHFVVYGILGDGVSSAHRLDSLGKGFADWIRSRYVDVPVMFLGKRRDVEMGDVLEG